MADTIIPTQPTPPALPVDHPPEDDRQQKKRPKQDNNKEEPSDDDVKKRPHKGLFDEYV